MINFFPRLITTGTVTIDTIFDTSNFCSSYNDAKVYLNDNPTQRVAQARSLKKKWLRKYPTKILNFQKSYLWQHQLVVQKDFQILWKLIGQYFRCQSAYLNFFKIFESIPGLEANYVSWQVLHVVLEPRVKLLGCSILKTAHYAPPLQVTRNLPAKVEECYYYTENEDKDERSIADEYKFLE